MLFVGLDLGTQSIKLVVLDDESRDIVWRDSVQFDADLPEFGSRDGLIPHHDTSRRHADPAMWAAGLERIFRRLSGAPLDLRRVGAVGASTQQRGTVYLRAGWEGNRAGESMANAVRRQLSRSTAPTWMDDSAGFECAEIVARAGGSERIQRVTGSVPLARFAGPQVRRFWRLHEAEYQLTERIHLVSSFVASILSGKDAPIDSCEAAGLTLWDINDSQWDQDLLQATAPDLSRRLPDVVPTATVLGNVSPWIHKLSGINPDAVVVVSTGDNPASFVPFGESDETVAVVSLGTSHTVSVAMARPRVDPAGFGSVAPGSCGDFNGLTVFRNGALTSATVLGALEVNLSQIDDILDSTPAGNGGNRILPYLFPEITPRVNLPSVRLTGSQPFEAGLDAAGIVRGLIESQVSRLRIYSRWMLGRPSVMRVTGGASKSRSLCQLLADVFDCEVHQMAASDGAAIGASLRAHDAVRPTASSRSHAPWRFQIASKVFVASGDSGRYRELLDAHEQLATVDLTALREGGSRPGSCWSPLGPRRL